MRAVLLLLAPFLSGCLVAQSDVRRQFKVQEGRAVVNFVDDPTVVKNVAVHEAVLTALLLDPRLPFAYRGYEPELDDQNRAMVKAMIPKINEALAATGIVEIYVGKMQPPRRDVFGVMVSSPEQNPVPLVVEYYCSLAVSPKAQWISFVWYSGGEGIDMGYDLSEVPGAFSPSEPLQVDFVRDHAQLVWKEP